MKKIILIIFLFLFVGCSQVKSDVQSGGIGWIRDMAQAKEAAIAQNKPILIDFYTEWCGWCKRLDKDTYANAKVIEAAKNFICVKIDAEKEKQLTASYNVRGFPSTVFLKSDGSLIEVVPGYLPPKDFFALLDRILK